MDKSAITEIKKKLTSEEVALKLQITKVIKPNATPGAGSVDADFPQYGTKEDDNANEVAVFQDNLSLENKLEGNLKDVQDALLKIKNNTFGKCETCGDIITDNRLNAFPTARECLNCKKGDQKN